MFVFSRFCIHHQHGGTPLEPEAARALPTAKYDKTLFGLVPVLVRSLQSPGLGHSQILYKYDKTLFGPRAVAAEEELFLDTAWQRPR